MSERRVRRAVRVVRSDIVGLLRLESGVAADVQDAVADVFLAAWRRLDDLPEGDAARVWLYATARKVIANQRGPVGVAPRSVSDWHWSPRPRTNRRRPIARRRWCTRRFGRSVRAIARCCCCCGGEGLSPAQIAAVLGCLTVTARGRLHRARRRFRAAFEDLTRASAAVPRRPE